MYSALQCQAAPQGGARDQCCHLFHSTEYNLRLRLHLQLRLRLRLRLRLCLHLHLHLRLHLQLHMRELR